ncbi:GPP34 family phosphoprotein [Agrococcus sp. SL85]|uniref:GOLPH3/VPS74 family protein n=1 Tax=Agrococcus sp. SL85 TaxID=2995141 RepID=UPI00226C6BAB|nr:GPP34 family phosphoprotein [Agrococcus sp. SL85]WAC67050.1 GPP34 family phosphoprotein [Agrococcus sp. SL85]
MDITIPEALLLLALDDERGTAILDDGTLGTALSAAAIAQLLVDGRVRIAGEGEPGARPGRLVEAAGASDDRLEPLVARIAGRTPTSALQIAAGFGGAGSPSGRVRRQLLDDFAELGVLVREQDRFLGMVWRDRWERGERRELEDALQARARAVLADADGAADDPADAPIDAALAILHGADALPKAFPDLDEAALRARGEALAEGSWASAQVREAVASMQAAMTAVLLTTVIMPASSS